MKPSEFKVSLAFQLTICAGAGAAIAFPQLLPALVAVGFLAIAQALASGFRTLAERLDRLDATDEAG